jgi:hypothetical protein
VDPFDQASLARLLAADISDLEPPKEMRWRRVCATASSLLKMSQRPSEAWGRFHESVPAGIYG